jgi:hypothetical protein
MKVPLVSVKCSQYMVNFEIFDSSEFHPYLYQFSTNLDRNYISLEVRSCRLGRYLRIDAAVGVCQGSVRDTTLEFRDFRPLKLE